MKTRPDQTTIKMMKMLNISEAKAQLSAVIREVVDEGQEVLISRAGRPVVKIVAYQPARQQRRLGLFEGQINIPEGFDEWPEDVARSLGILD